MQWRHTSHNNIIADTSLVLHVYQSLLLLLLLQTESSSLLVLHAAG